jgi:hypothetical protein
MRWYKFDKSTNYIFNDNFVVLIWIDGPAKNYRDKYMSRVMNE